MSRIQFSENEPSGVVVEDKTSEILRDFLQPDSKLTIQSAARQLLGLLPDQDPNGVAVWTWGEVVVQLAEDIPWAHPSHIKLVRLLESLSVYAKLNTKWTLENMPTTPQYTSFQRLGESLLDHLDPPDDSETSPAYVNYQAFCAHLEASSTIRSDSPTWAIWAHRYAFEGFNAGRIDPPPPPTPEPPVRDALVMGAAQWILWYGQGLFKHVLYPGEETRERSWHPGPLYPGADGLDVERWRFWREGYRRVARGVVVQDEKDESEGGEKWMVDAEYGDECRLLARRAVDLMDAIERGMMF